MKVTLQPNGCALYAGREWQLISQPGQGMRVFVEKNRHSAFNQLKNKARSNYNALYLYSQLMSLNNRHGMLRSLVSRAKMQQMRLQLEGGSINYNVVDGCVFIGEFGFSGGKSQVAGLYKIERLSPQELDTKAISGISTKNIAINGAFSDLDGAARAMPSFIERGYKPDTTQASLNHDGFCLFFNTCGAGISSDMRQFVDTSSIGGGTQGAQKLAKLIRLEAKKAKEVQWTLHEKGHAVFKQALSIALREMTTTEKSRLSKHKVFYANPTMNLNLIDSYRKEAGMQLAPQPPLLNNTSLEQTWVTGNFVSESVISYRQLKEQGENGLRNVTAGNIASNALTRLGILGIGSYAVPTLGIGIAGWAVAWGTLVASNIGNPNHKVMENGADFFNHVFNCLSKK
ncbi:hypothetical protein [Teredinibacter turnerae]|uniref:hypothetical protein n=1 Tax=Teredinibacter turnerae TaxID=2426 RepID=UPI000360D2F8|nr:hypothetical protein [Teredinibacter turnerae]